MTVKTFIAHLHPNPLYIYSEYLRKVPPATAYGLKGEGNNVGDSPLAPGGRELERVGFII